MESRGVPLKKYRRSERSEESPLQELGATLWRFLAKARNDVNFFRNDVKFFRNGVSFFRSDVSFLMGHPCLC